MVMEQEELHQNIVRVSLSSSSHIIFFVSTLPNVFRWQLTFPPGPVGIQFSKSLIPPTVIRVTAVEAEDIPPYSSLVSFNGISTLSWSLADLSDILEQTKDDDKVSNFHYSPPFLMCCNRSCHSACLLSLSTNLDMIPWSLKHW